LKTYESKIYNKLGANYAYRAKIKLIKEKIN